MLVESAAPVESAGGDLVVVGRTYRDAPEVDGLAFVKGEFCRRIARYGACGRRAALRFALFATLNSG